MLRTGLLPLKNEGVHFTIALYTDPTFVLRTGLLPLKNEGVHFNIALYTESTAGRGKSIDGRTKVTKIRSSNGQSSRRKSIPDPNRISQTHAANEAGQEAKTKVLK